MEGPLYLHKDQLYLVPESLPDLGELRSFTAGFQSGCIEKGRFIPSHALALALKKQQVFQSIDLPGSSIEIRQYINGQTLNGFDGKGWVLVTVDGYSAGWGKLSEGLLKIIIQRDYGVCCRIAMTRINPLVFLYLKGVEL